MQVLNTDHSHGMQVLNTAHSRIDWSSLSLPGWITGRTENLGYRFPTEVQRRAAPVITSGADAVIQSETGSGKTIAFLVPALARLDFPPLMYLDDLKGPQCLVLVPTMELGVQVGGAGVWMGGSRWTGCSSGWGSDMCVQYASPYQAFSLVFRRPH